MNINSSFLDIDKNRLTRYRQLHNFKAPKKVIINDY